MDKVQRGTSYSQRLTGVMGRPKKTISLERRREILEASRVGTAKGVLAKLAEMSRPTFDKYLKDNENFSYQLDRAHAQSIVSVSKRLLEGDNSALNWLQRHTRDGDYRTVDSTELKNDIEDIKAAMEQLRKEREDGV